MNPVRNRARAIAPEGPRGRAISNGVKVLAIDPGYGRCGVAVLEKTGGKEVLVYSNCIETATTDDFVERLAAVSDGCTRLMKKFEPDAVAIEKLFFSNNQKTAMHVAEIRGALIAAAAARDIPVFEYGPGQVKSATTGSGRADKRQVVKMLHTLLQIGKNIRYDDEYDAIAIGITHLATARAR